MCVGFEGFFFFCKMLIVGVIFDVYFANNILFLEVALKFKSLASPLSLCQLGFVY